MVATDKSHKSRVVQWVRLDGTSLQVIDRGLVAYMGVGGHKIWVYICNFTHLFFYIIQNFLL